MIFKTLRQEQEWAQAVAAGYMIVPVVTFAAETSLRLFGKQVVITEILRTDAEQRALLAGLRPPVEYYATVHSSWRGADIRSRDYTRDEIGILRAAINKRFEYGRGKEVALFHDMGAGAHFHLQAPAQFGTWKG